MTKTEVKAASTAVKDILLSDPTGLHEVIRAMMQEVLEAEMNEALGIEGGADAEAAGLPLRLLWRHAGHPCRQA